MIGTANQASRLGKLEAPQRPGARPGGVLVLPPIEANSCVWSGRAIASQTALANATREGIDKSANVRAT